MKKKRDERPNAFCDNAEEGIKCSNCGFMFTLDDAKGNSKESDKLECPSCGEETEPEKTKLMGMSNEDY